MDNWFRYYRQPKKLRIEFPSPNGEVQVRWIDYEEWKFLQEFLKSKRK